MSAIASIHKTNLSKVLNEKMRILVVEDGPDSADLLVQSICAKGYDCLKATSVSEMYQQLRSHTFTAILLDIFLGNSETISEIPKIIKNQPQTKIVVMTAAPNYELATQAMKAGASSFVSKAKGLTNVLDELQSVLATTATLLKNGEFSEGYGLIGVSEEMRRVRQSIHQMKDVNSTVLIYGESGTGKELVANALHAASQRSVSRFAAINCGAIPENLLESELYGHKKGAFTDAKTDRKGYFELCSGGTLFLDEIGEMPLQQQVKLLRVLESREITPVGASQPISIDTRIVVATNRDLKLEVAERRFREDLFYRLSVLRIEIPPLRRRTEDIPHLVQHFVTHFNHKFGKYVQPPSYEVSARLKLFPWKGNVRELQNQIERGVVLSASNQLNLESLTPQNDELESSQKTETHSTIPKEWAHLPFAEVEECCQHEYFSNLLRATHGNISEVSRISGEHRARIYRIVKKLRIDLERYKVSF